MKFILIPNISQTIIKITFKLDGLYFLSIYSFEKFCTINYEVQLKNRLFAALTPQKENTPYTITKLVDEIINTNSTIPVPVNDRS